jgi:hypothetical protein
MAGLSITPATGYINSDLKYVGGMFVEFYRQTIRDGVPRADRIGRNKSFIEDDRWRITGCAPWTNNGTDLLYDPACLYKELAAYVSGLTGSGILLNTENVSPFDSFESFSGPAIFTNSTNSAPNPNAPGYYPMLLNKTQSSALFKRYSNLNQAGPADAGMVSARRNAILQNLKADSFTCEKCIQQPFTPIYDNDGVSFDCNEGKNNFHFTLKKEYELNNQGIQMGGTVDCRCCGSMTEMHWWNDSYFCARPESVCLPLTVLENNLPIGFSDYGSDMNVVPFFCNIDKSLGNMSRGSSNRFRKPKLETVSLNYVANGVIKSGFFINHWGKTGQGYIDGLIEPFLYKSGASDITGVFLCNNAFRGHSGESHY